MFLPGILQWNNFYGGIRNFVWVVNLIAASIVGQKAHICCQILVSRYVSLLLNSSKYFALFYSIFSITL